MKPAAATLQWGAPALQGILTALKACGSQLHDVSVEKQPLRPPLRDTVYPPQFLSGVVSATMSLMKATQQPETSSRLGRAMGLKPATGHESPQNTRWGRHHLRGMVG